MPSDLDEQLGTGATGYGYLLAGLGVGGVAAAGLVNRLAALPRLGAVILGGGAEVKRLALPNAKILIHQVSGGFQGQATDIEIQARETIALKRRLEELLSEHTGRPQEQVAKDMERDYFMTSQEAQAYGIIDNVIAHR